jgi:hypothetical protein
MIKKVPSVISLCYLHYYFCGGIWSREYGIFCGGAYQYSRVDFFMCRAGGDHKRGELFNNTIQIKLHQLKI